MKAWVSRVRYDRAKTDKRGEPKRSFEKLAPGVTGVKDGDEFYVFLFIPPKKTRKEKVPIHGKPGKRLADRRADELRARLTLGTYQDKRRVAWSEFCRLFDEREIALLRPGSQRVYRESLALFELLCKPGLVSGIDAETVVDFRTRLAKRRGIGKDFISPATVNRHLRPLRRALNMAAKWGYLDRKVEIEMLDEPQKAVRFIPDDEFELIWGACDKMPLPRAEAYTPGDFWRAIVLLAYTTGMRRGELLCAEWEDTHLDEGWLLVHWETAKGKRDDVVPLSPALIPYLRKIQDVGRMVFDWPYNASALTDWFRRLQEMAGCRGRYGFHDLKRTCGTMNAARMTPAELNAYMRHRSRETTDKFYLHKETLRSGAAAKAHIPACVR